MTALTELTIAAAAALLRGRKISPVELVDACLARIAAVDGTLHAFILVTADQARADARRAEAEIGRGQWRGPLHGVPIGLKYSPTVSISKRRQPTAPASHPLQ